MATRKARRGRARAGGPARKHPAFRGDFREQLVDVVRQLRVATAAIVVSVEALRRQNVELDEEIALVLQRHASDRIGAEIERLEQVIAGAPS